MKLGFSFLSSTLFLLADMEAEFAGATPRFTRKLKDVDAVPGKAARMECQVIGDPQPDIRWYRENEPLLEGGRYMFEENGDLQVLIINDVTANDEGLYKCVARNCAGKAHCSADLLVARKCISKGRTLVKGYIL